ncbi:MAG: hypothetical protein ACXVBF_01190 [Flavisolibacter sp.]
MKNVLSYIAILLLLTASHAQAQKKTGKSKSAVSKTISANKAISSSTAQMLNSVGDYPAKSSTNNISVATNNYTVSDPILTTLAARANGANIRFNSSGIVGMPKSAYGFANGHIALKTSGSVTSGTETGSGAVATGTSLATFGSVGEPMNVNGKSPYAGINMWGNAMNMRITNADSSVRMARSKKQ